VLILGLIELGALRLDLPVMESYSLVCVHHSDVSAGDQCHSHDYLNQPKSPIADKAL
jgi:hypothetical protein